jgi:hypothetical protein
MAFSDDLARDPKSEEEFWEIIEETFVQVEGVLADYPVETRDEALTGPFDLVTMAPTEAHRAISFAIAALVRRSTTASTSLNAVGGFSPR